MKLSRRASRMVRLTASALLCCAPTLGAELNSLFSDNAVFQQNKEIPVWGTGRNGETVTVKVGHRAAATTVRDGKWAVTLGALPPGGPHTLVVQGDRTLAITNILVGEVWICSGQSNMERQLGPRSGQKPLDNWEQEAAAANFPQIRMFFVPRNPSSRPVEDARGKWVVCAPQTARDFSAVGYFFAREIHRNQRVPVGMIFSAVGGTAAELWTSPEALAANATGAEVLRSHGQAIREFPAKAASYKAKEPELLAQYTNALIAARAAGAPEPSLPAAPRDPSGSEPGLLFNGMIAPLIPYAMRGAIWYQGESNGGRGIAYRELFPLLIHDWRKRWHEEFPFCYVQLATYAKCDPLVREAQFLTLSKALNTAMVVTTDLGDANDVHPTRKREVGERLALTALAIAYHQAVDYSGPLYESCEFQGAEARLTFKHSRGLTASSGALAGFVIAGADKKFLPATAVVRGETVVVSSAAVQKPMAVRYNWAGVADGNLCNGAGLPASPFRTDVEPDR